jgi:hypothetical protein
MRAMVAMTAALVLAGCQITIPDFRPGAPSAGGGGGTGFGGGGATAGEAARAERACRAVAADRGLAVNAIADNREVLGSGGVVIGRDVMLNVTRAGQTYTVRCSYTMTTDEARLMML